MTDRSVYAHVISALQDALVGEGVWVLESPQRLRGPGSVGVILDNTHTEDWHVDVGLQLNRDEPHVPVLWDCMAVDPRNLEATAQFGVTRWQATTFATMKELVYQSGEFAGHLGGDHPDGLPGWHVISSPFFAWGASSGDLLGEWLLEHPLLPALAATCLPELDRSDLNTLKVVFGGGVSAEVAEVRINGSFVDAASDALLGLAWPRIETTWVRAYMLLIREVDHT